MGEARPWEGKAPSNLTHTVAKEGRKDFKYVKSMIRPVLSGIALAAGGRWTGGGKIEGSGGDQVCDEAPNSRQ